MASHITNVSMFAKLLARAQFKENIKAPRHWPVCREFADDRYPRTKGQ